MAVDLDGLSGGYDTARVRVVADAADARARAERDADAIAYLLRGGNKDLLPVLGLDGYDGTTRCAAPGCDNPFPGSRRGGRQRCCSIACANRLGAAERQANRNERAARRA